MNGPALRLTSRQDAADAATVLTVNEALGVLALAASSRISDPELERDRVELLADALSAARAASAALHMWAVQFLSEYRGSRTTWDVHATSELLGRTLTEFDATAREVANRLVAILRDVPGDGPTLRRAAAR